MTRTTMISLGMAAAMLSAGAPARAAGDPLEAAATQQVSAAAAGARPTGQFLRGSAAKTDYSVILDANTCYWFSGVSAGKVKKLALYLWAPGAGFFTPRLTDARSESGAVVMAHCTKEAGMYKMQAKIEGSGSYVVGLFAKAAPRQPDAPPAAAAAPAAAPDYAPVCDGAAARTAPGAARVGALFAGKGSMWSNDTLQGTVLMEAGTCYWLIGCTKPGESRIIDLQLLGQDNSVIAAPASPTASPVVGHCAAAAGMYKFRARFTYGKGDYAVGVYAKATAGVQAAPAYGTVYVAPPAVQVQPPAGQITVSGPGVSVQAPGVSVRANVVGAPGVGGQVDVSAGGASVSGTVQVGAP